MTTMPRFVPVAEKTSQRTLKTAFVIEFIQNKKQGYQLSKP